VARFFLGGLLLLTLVGTGTAETLTAPKRYADASSDACRASCSSTSAQCKRICPTVLGAPCVASCDSQYQTCIQACQNR
jgi:hypothetical protein